MTIFQLISSSLFYIIICNIGRVYCFTPELSLSHESPYSLLRTKNDFPVTQLRAQGGVQRNLSNFFFGNKSGDEKKNNSMQIFDESTDIVIIGGGVSGLTAALTAASEEENLKIVLVEASSNLGGRVQSDYTKDGFILDKGFAVFIDQYPSAAKLLDLSNLQLKPYLPGALIKVSDSPKSDFVRVADPLRQPEEIWNALVVPVGSISDKVKLMPLLWNVRTKSIEELFQEEETSTEYALQKRWGFSKEMITTFFEPFLKGIYLSSLSQQSSLMFSFVMKMFSEGSANLPMNGMGAVTEQLAQKARDQGVDIRTNVPVTLISQEDSSDSGDKKWIINCESTGVKLLAQSVIVATDGQVAQRLLSDVHGFESLQTLPRQPQRSVGCLYYSFQGEPPVTQPILILNGIAKDTSVVEDNKDQLINNLSFPSVVNPGYAPEGYHLCSVTVLQDFMEHYSSQIELDAAVRQQLALWFPEHQQDILQTWELKQVYNIQNAQPSQYQGPFPANINGGRLCSTFRDKELPEGILVCGDHMATATLNGALESGVNAGTAAAKAVAMKVDETKAAKKVSSTGTAVSD